MPTVVMLEALAFGLDHLAAAAERHGVGLVLLTFDRAYYRRQLAACGERVRVVDVDTFDLGAVRKALDGLGPVDGLIANTDTWSPIAEALAAEYGFPNVLRGSALFRDKTAVRNRLAEAGLTAARAVRGDRWAATPAAQRPPLAIVKDAAGTSSKHVHLAESAAEVDALIAGLTAKGVPAERITIEPYACGPLFSAETYSTAEGTTLLGISSRTMSELPEFRELDLTFPVGHGTAWEREIEVWAGEVLRVLGRGTGPAHIEFIRTAEGPELVEVNPRLGGGHIGEAVLRTTGVDVYELLLAQALEPRIERRHLAAATHRPETGGYAQVLKYTRRTGPLGEVTGAEALAAFPGEVGWTRLKAAGDEITAVTDQGACYGFLTATGPSPEEALQRALAAARHLRIRTTGEEHGR
ncbi:ATP-grasp domain-containing protein [Kitasatospora sp. MMS16-BH015]|uniref:ATP-grasp domain-containing protein n=1 Tax=Kitasatospora sp. MMS16-BH015 TaxID=2018025 RepID=UPI000CA1ABF2|nr:ATP-grasp domain-containing protein [Kitasatospora sp. MMS16-BH015]AUG78800.1 ATP-grasp domain-containing protein [Kitasatospora sp. MMS16-BH015]